eukprot:gene2684-3652_t
MGSWLGVTGRPHVVGRRDGDPASAHAPPGTNTRSRWPSGSVATKVCPKSIWVGSWMIVNPRLFQSAQVVSTVAALSTVKATSLPPADAMTAGATVLRDHQHHGRQRKADHDGGQHQGLRQGVGIVGQRGGALAIDDGRGIDPDAPHQEDEQVDRIAEQGQAQDQTALLESFMGVPDTPENRAKFVSTIPLGRMSKPSDIASACVYLGSDEAEFLTGVILPVDGAN